MSEPDSEAFIPDMDAIAAASIEVVIAEAAVVAAAEKAGAAADVLADADDDVTVAQTKVDDYDGDDTKLPWQIAAAQRELAKKTRAQARATRRHDDAQHELTQARQRLDDAKQALDVARRTPAPPDEEDESEIRLLVWSVPLKEAPAELIDWVEGVLQDYLTGSVGPLKGARWCARWSEHPDALHRLAAIYDQWTLMRLGGKQAPTLHTFVRDVLDYHMPYLTSREFGVLGRCDMSGHEPHQRVDAG